MCHETTSVLNWHYMNKKGIEIEAFIQYALGKKLYLLITLKFKSLVLLVAAV